MVRILDLEKYAQDNNIPIMLPDGIEFLLDYIKKNNIKNILEIGTAIGYSAIRMCLIDQNIKVTTIERDEKRYKEALKNISEFNLTNQINVILDDALNTNIKEKFDLIFIDAAKSQYINFFEKYKINLNSNGVIVSDNLKFHGLVETPINEIESRNVRGLVRKLNNYIDFLKNNQEFKTTFYDIGDGISVSVKDTNTVKLIESIKEIEKTEDWTKAEEYKP